MTYFLTSCTVIPGTITMNPANGFIEKLKNQLPQRPLNVLFISSSADDFEKNDKFSGFEKITFEDAGFTFATYNILDGRTASKTEEWLSCADLVILAGGHVPTQNAFFSEIRLKELIGRFGGVVVGISAGTMNAAETVYAIPEAEGEAVSKEYKKFIPGLGITKIMVIPHYNTIKDDVLDGMRLFEDIAYPDSRGQEFYVLTDGSYIYGHDGIEELCGEAYLLRDGKMQSVAVLYE